MQFTIHVDSADKESRLSSIPSDKGSGGNGGFGMPRKMSSLFSQGDKCPCGSTVARVGCQFKCVDVTNHTAWLESEEGSSPSIAPSLQDVSMG